MVFSSKENEILNKRYKKNVWSFEEICFRDRLARRNPKLINKKIPSSLVLETHLKLSVLGRFMHQFNLDQYKSLMVNENKLLLEKYDKKKFTNKEKEYWDFQNSFSENLFELLEKSIEEKRHIDIKYLQEKLEILRLNNSPMNTVDSLRKFKRLKILTLGTNWLDKIEGKKLPRNLEMLELFSNQISCLKSFCEKCCKRLKYLGLERNLLNEGSSCHLLATSGNFTQLAALDLSNNNFQNIREILQQIGALENLGSLSLEGNPCYTTEGYTEIVLKSFPKLKFLDDMEVLEEDKISDTDNDLISGSTKGSFIFTCYKLAGIPQPPKGKGIYHTFHIEVELPFLEDLIHKEKISIVSIEDGATENKIKTSVEIKEVPKVEKEVDNKKGKKGKKENRDKTEKPEKTEKSKTQEDKSKRKSVNTPKAIHGTGIYGLQDKTHSRYKHHLKTEERLFSKSLKFNNPSITAIPPDNDLTLLRDTFRSKIKVNIVYVQKASPKKEKIPKKLKTNVALNITNNPVEPPPDIILKTSTVASFYCDLKNVNWSNDYVDFIWTDTKDFGNKAYCVPGSLKPEIFLEKKKTQKSTIKRKTLSQIPVVAPKELQIINDFEQIPMPATLTCLVGFGLWRNGMVKEEVAEETKEKKK